MQIDDQHTSVYDFVTDGTPTDVVARYASLKTQALHADYGDLDRNIVVIDTETTAFPNEKTSSRKLPPLVLSAAKSLNGL